MQKKHLNPFEDQPNGMRLNSQLSFILLNKNYDLHVIRAFVKYLNFSSDKNVFMYIQSVVHTLYHLVYEFPNYDLQVQNFLIYIQRV